MWWRQKTLCLPKTIWLGILRSWTPISSRDPLVILKYQLLFKPKITLLNQILTDKCRPLTYSWAITQEELLEVVQEFNLLPMFHSIHSKSLWLGQVGLLEWILKCHPTITYKEKSMILNHFMKSKAIKTSYQRAQRKNCKMLNWLRKLTFLIHQMFSSWMARVEEISFALLVEEDLLTPESTLKINVKHATRKLRNFKKIQKNIMQWVIWCNSKLGLIHILVLIWIINSLICSLTSMITDLLRWSMEMVEHIQCTKQIATNSMQMKVQLALKDIIVLQNELY